MRNKKGIAVFLFGVSIVFALVLLSGCDNDNGTTHTWDYTITAYPAQTQTVGQYAYFTLKLNFSDQSRLYIIEIRPTAGTADYFYMEYNYNVQYNDQVMPGAYPTDSSFNAIAGTFTAWKVVVKDNSTGDVLHESDSFNYSVTW